MVHNNMDILLINVIMHVNNINFSHYKTVMDKLDGVVVKMNKIMFKSMDQHHVDLLEVHGVIMSGKIMDTLLQLNLHNQPNQMNIHIKDNIKIHLIEH